MSRPCLALLGGFFMLSLPIAAQTSSAPSVSVRRDVRLNHTVFPADFNGDGIIDLVAHDPFSSGTRSTRIIIALGNGDGTFKTPTSTGADGTVLATGDFNNDGKVDILFAAAAQLGVLPAVRVLPGRGDATFDAARTIAQTSTIYFGLVADIDGDHNQDVVVGVNDFTADQVLVIPGNGDFTFDAAAVLTPGALPTDAAATDLNGDSRNDLVVANHDGHSISVFLNLGGLNFTAADVPLPRQANGVAPFDINRDGKMDVIVATSSDANDDFNYVDGFATVLTGKGDGTFATPIEYRTAPGAWTIVVGDFTRDGIPDIATANRSALYTEDCGPLLRGFDSVSILPGASNGTFATASSFSLGNQRTPSSGPFRNSVLSLAAVDVNRDGAADLVASWGAIVITRPPDPNWSPSVVASASTPSADHSVRLTASASDSDQDFLTYRWTDNGMEFSNVPDPCYTPATLGVHTFTVTVDDRHGHTVSSSVIVDFGSPSGAPPAVTVIAPAAGEVLDEGRPYNIRWSATNDTALSNISVSFSTDDGGHRQVIPECASLAGTANSCTWNAVGPVTNFGRISVAATDTSGRIGSATSGRFIVRAAPGRTLPEGWSHADVGNVGASGSASHDGFIWNGQGLTVSGSGADIWGTTDEFHYVWKTMTGTFEIETRVSSVQAINAWTKAGLMVRASALDPSSPHASIFVTAAKGIAFQRRAARGGTTEHTSGAALAAPVWLRLVRQGDVLTAFYKKQLTDQWTSLGHQLIAGLPSTVAVGLAVTSHVDGTLATAKFEGVYLSSIPGWARTEIGGATGTARPVNETIYTVTGSGTDIWGTSDSFTYMWVPISGRVSVTVRVLGISNTHAWAKAGLMIRESLAPGAKHVDAVVTPGKGLAMQYRSATDGTSANVSLKAGTAPVFIRLVASPGSDNSGIGFVQANYSFDGTLWRILGQVSVPMTRDAYVGVAVTSHNPSVETTATFDHLRVER